MKVTRKLFWLITAWGALAAWPLTGGAQPAPEVSTCGTEPMPPACAAVRGGHGYQVLELPPPSQGFATEKALNILEACVPAMRGRPVVGSAYDLVERGASEWRFAGTIASE